jgi:hypothetical protein
MAFSMGAYNAAFSIAMAPFVLYATDVLAVPDAAYGLLLAMSALGGVVAGWQAGPLTRRMSYRQTMALVHAMQAVAWAGIALAGDPWVTGPLLALLGAASSLSSVAVGSARQALTPDQLLGRVVAAFRLLGMGLAGLGAVTGGVIADIWGLTAPLVAATAILIVAGTLTWPFRHQR